MLGQFSGLSRARPLRDVEWRLYLVATRELPVVFGRTFKMGERYLHIMRADLRAAVEAGQPRPTATRTATEVEALLQDVDL
jgi:hypothetical protein